MITVLAQRTFQNLTQPSNEMRLTFAMERKMREGNAEKNNCHLQPNVGITNIAVRTSMLVPIDQKHCKKGNCNKNPLHVYIYIFLYVYIHTNLLFDLLVGKCSMPKADLYKSCYKEMSWFLCNCESFHPIFCVMPLFNLYGIRTIWSSFGLIRDTI